MELLEVLEGEDVVHLGGKMVQEYADLAGAVGEFVSLQQALVRVHLLPACLAFQTFSLDFALYYLF